MEVKNKYDSIIKLFEIYKSNRQEVDFLRQEISNYVVPYREDYEANDNGANVIIPRRKGTYMFDGTAMSALMIATDGIHGNTISPSVRWFSKDLPQKFKQYKNNREVKIWLSDYNECLYEELKNSDFYEKMRVFIRDALSISPGIIFVDENILRGTIHFKALHPKNCYFEKNINGEISTFIRTQYFTPEQAVEMFGINNPGLSKNLLDAYKNQSQQMFCFIHFVGQRKNYDCNCFDILNMPFESIWIQRNHESKTIARESGFEKMPYFTWSYFESSLHPYGETPAVIALPEIKRLNIISKSIAGSAQLSTEPPYNIPSEMKGKVSLGPNGMNYYTADYNRRIYRIDQPSNFPIALDRENKISNMIKEVYNVDFFMMMLNNIARVKNTNEIEEMIGERALLLNPMICSLERTLDKILDYVAYLGMKWLRFPPTPDILVNAAGNVEIDTVFNGILTQIQRRSFQSKGIISGLQMATPLVQLLPDSRDIINGDKTLEKIMTAYGFPTECFNETNDIKAVRQARSAAAQDASNVQKQEILSKIAKNIAQADKNTKGKLSEQMTNIMGPSPQISGGLPAGLPAGLQTE